MSDLTAEQAQQLARQLQKDARLHKRAEFQHRKKACERMEQLAALRRECERRGINLNTDKA